MITRPGDIVLIHQGGKPMIHARVEEILADHKPGWWHLRLLILAVPTQELTWILREEYIDGDEFTMGGVAMMLKRLAPPRPAEPPAQEPRETPSQAEAQTTEPAPGPAKVLSLTARRPK